MSTRNKLVVPGAQNAIDQMKAEIAKEFGVNLGPDTSSRQNGSVGGEITKRLIKQAQQQLSGNSEEQSCLVHDAIYLTIASGVPLELIPSIKTVGTLSNL